MKRILIGTASLAALVVLAGAIVLWRRAGRTYVETRYPEAA